MSSDTHKTYHSSHDLFFRSMMSKPEVAREFLEAYLPQEVLSCLDFATLKQENCSFVTPVLTAYQGDTLYSIQFGNNTAYIMLLVEHQSTQQKLMPLRIHTYTTLIMNHFVDERREKPLPLIASIVLYHGEQPYRYSTDIRDYIDAPKPFIDCFFNKPFKLVDLRSIDDATLIEQKVWACIMQMTLKHIRDKDAEPFIQFMMKELLKPLDQVTHSEKIEIVLKYFLDKANINDKEAFKQVVHETLDQSLEETVMTTMTQHWRDEGRDEGREEGRLEERAEMQRLLAKELWTENEPIERIARLLTLSIDKVKALVAEESSRH